MKFRISEPVFETSITVYCGQKCRNLKVDYDGAWGYFANLDDKNGLLWLADYEDFTNDLEFNSTVGHEVNHGVGRFLNFLDIECEETRAYLHEFYFKKIIKKIKNEKNKKGN